MASSITPTAYDNFTNIERACSILSVLGCLFIIGTFLSSKSFHKPINRLVFYASFGNLMTNVGTLLSRTYVAFPNSAGCQLQAFLIQMYVYRLPLTPNFPSHCVNDGLGSCPQMPYGH